jgi:hypothetical protein
LAISRLPFESPNTKCHLDVGLMKRHTVYYKGEGGGFPQVQAVVSLVNLSRPWLVLTPKVFQLCNNHLMLVLCRSVWVVEACQFFLVPPWNSSMPLYPSKVMWARERASTLYSFDVFSLDSHLSSSRSWERVKVVVFLGNCKVTYGLNNWSGLNWGKTMSLVHIQISHLIN